MARIVAFLRECLVTDAWAAVRLPRNFFTEIPLRGDGQECPSYGRTVEVEDVEGGKDVEDARGGRIKRGKISRKGAKAQISERKA